MTLSDQSSDAGQESSQSSGSNAQTPKRRTIKSFMDTMTPEDQEVLTRELAIAIFASGTPLSIVENKYWVAFFKSLRPCFKLPSRKVLSTTLLDQVYGEVRDTVFHKVQGAQKVTLIFDGWTNLRKNGVIHYVASTPSPVLFEVHEVKAAHKTGEYLAEVTEGVMEKIGPEKVFSLATDSAKDMKKAW